MKKNNRGANRKGNESPKKTKGTSKRVQKPRRDFGDTRPVKSRFATKDKQQHEQEENRRGSEIPKNEKGSSQRAQKPRRDFGDTRPAKSRFATKDKQQHEQDENRRGSEIPKNETGSSQRAQKPRRDFGDKEPLKSRFVRKTTTQHVQESNEKPVKTHKTPGGYRAHKKKSHEKIRLNKYISNAGYCSRREADTLISSGAVTVNGTIITELGYKVDDDVVVKVDNQTLKQEKMQYVLINKPKDVITTCDDPQGRMTVLNLIKGACRERIYPVGRLDRNTTGLLILTNDGDFAKKIAHPSSKVKKLYEVTLDKKLKSTDFEEISKGVWLDENTFVDVDDLAYAEGVKSGTVVGIEIHSGKYHVVKRIFEKFGYLVTKLDRTKIDVLTKKDLPRGRWRFLSESEIQLLKRH